MSPREAEVNPDVARRESSFLFLLICQKTFQNSARMVFNVSFKYADEFEELLVRSDSLNTESIPATFRKVGKLNS
jgi:hypothetical protein